VNQGPYDMNAWKYGSAFNPPAGTKIWNPVKIKLMQGGKVTGGTVRAAADPSTYCAMASAGYDFIWTEMQHSPTTWDNAVKAWTSCPRAKAVPGARIAYTDEKEIQQALDGGALVLVVPTVDTVAEAIQARDWAFFPPLGKRSLGGGAAFAPEMWGSVPGGYRNTINDNLVLILMIETLEGLKNADEIAKVPGVSAVFAASSDLGNFSGYQQGSRTTSAPSTSCMTRRSRPMLSFADRLPGRTGRISPASRPATRRRRSPGAPVPSSATSTTLRERPKSGRLPPDNVCRR